MRAMRSSGPIAPPRRHPVIAYFLLKVYRMTVRSCMPGSDAIDLLRPEYRTSQ